MNRELADAETGFRNSRGTRDQISNICWNIEKQEDSRKISTSASLDMLKPLTMWITINLKIFKGMGIPEQLTCLLRNLHVG